MILGSGVSPKAKVEDIHKYFMGERHPIEWSIDDSFRTLYNLIYTFCKKQLGDDANYEHVLEFCNQYNKDSLVAKALKALAGGDLVDKSIFKDDLSERLHKLAKHMKIKLKLILETKEKDKKDYEEHLSLIKKIIDSKKYTTINILTLNHDTVIEEYLKSFGCEFNEPFEVLKIPDVDGVKYFDAYKVGDWFCKLQQNSNDDGKPMVNLIKLHGSIDWAYLTYSKSEGLSKTLEGLDTLMRYPLHLSKELDSGGCIKHEVGANNIIEYNKLSYDKRGGPLVPSILVGTESKRSGYDTYYHSKIFQIAHLLMENTDHLLVSGYGGRDSGITQIIHNWIVSLKTKNRKVCIIDRNEGAIKRILKQTLLADYFRIISFIKHEQRESEDNIKESVKVTLFSLLDLNQDDEILKEMINKITLALKGDQTNEEAIESVLDEYIQLFIDKALESDTICWYQKDDKPKVSYLKKEFGKVDLKEVLKE